MSYQTITDINLSSQQDITYQIKDFVKESENVSSSKTNFQDLVSFYQQNNNTEETKVSNTDSNKVETEKNDSVDSKNVEKSETEEPQETDKNEKLEKTEQSEKKDKSEKSEKNVKSEETEKISNLEETIIPTETSHNVKKEDVKDIKNEKKLSEKDFSRLNHIADENTVDKSEISKDVKDKKSVKNEKTTDNLKVFEGDENQAALNQLENSENNTNLNNSNNKNNSDELNFVSKSEKKDKVFLDKDKKIEVQDFRSVEGKIADNEADKNPKIKVSEPKLVNQNTAQITMELNQTANANVLSSNNQAAASNGSNFQAMLNNQIQQSAPEFVKAGNLILKDNNQGTINLVLRPDDLGNVKLHLSLDGKNISGHITVATKEALEVFKDNAETLREAFIKNGFDSASFDVSYSGNQGSFNQEMAFEQQDGKELFAKRVYGNGVAGDGGDISSTGENNFTNSEYSINIVA